MTCYVSYSATPQGVCIHVSGDVDLSVGDVLYDVLCDTLDHTVGTVEVNLRQVTFLDCVGLTTLLRALDHAHRRARVLFVSQPQGIALWTLGITGLLTALTADAPMQAQASADSGIN